MKARTVTLHLNLSVIPVVAKLALCVVYELSAKQRKQIRSIGMQYI
jgi:hypothetical protein